MNRQEKLKALRANPSTSVLIVGAGINGIGTFRDLALQGVDVILVDKGDYCSGTSAASSRMVHGGIRYLENGEFSLVREAVGERNLLLKNAPHYVKPLPTTIPIFKFASGLANAPLKFLGLLDRPSERGALIIKAGLIMYDLYTGHDSSVPKHTVQSRRASLRQFPLMNPSITQTATYYDAAMRIPERIGLELVLDGEAAHQQALALNYMSVTGASGIDVTLRDELTQESYAVRPDLIINAAGPWIDIANRQLGHATRFIGGTKGSHIVVDHPQLREAIANNEIFFENEDGRIVLIYPIEDKVIIGTSDLPFEDNPDNVRCTEEEIDYFFGMIERVFPTITLARGQIVYTYSGVRPLPASDANTTGQISRNHSIKVTDPDEQLDLPIYSLIGGKWTSFRAFSSEVADKALRYLERPRQVGTEPIPIGGGRNHPVDEAARTAWLLAVREATDLPITRLEQLLERYGTRAKEFAEFICDGDDRPLAHHPGYSRREIIFITLQEQVEQLADVVLRRSLMATLGELTPGLISELAELVGGALNWSATMQREQIDETYNLLATRHRIDIGQRGIMAANAD